MMEVFESCEVDPKLYGTHCLKKGAVNQLSKSNKWLQIKSIHMLDGFVQGLNTVT